MKTATPSKNQTEICLCLYEVFAKNALLETKSQFETVNALLNQYPELAEDEAETIAISAYEDAQGERQAKGEAMSDELRGN